MTATVAANREGVASAADCVNNPPPTPREFPAALYDLDTRLDQIPLEHLGVLCDLAPTSKNPKGTHIPMIRKCYVHLLSQMQHDNDIANTALWTKLLLLARVLITPTAEDGKWRRRRRN